MDDIYPIPDWLYEKPVQMIEPPVTTRIQELPLEKLEWENFERLCLRLASLEEKVISCGLYGNRGQKQEGIDFYTQFLNDRYNVYQCKKVKRVHPGELRKAVQVFLDGDWFGIADTFIICMSISCTNNLLVLEIERQRSRLQEKGVRLDVWDVHKLSLLLKSQPGIVSEFFHPAWVELFCDTPVSVDVEELDDDKYLRLLRARMREDWLNAKSYREHFTDPRINLTLSIREDAINQRWGDVVSTPATSSMLPEGTTICTLWDKGCQSQLVLGVSGSGKSLALSQLAEKLLSHSKTQGYTPVPVILKLATWKSDKTLFDWICAELKNRYDIPEKIAVDWILNDDIVLLLDGLDEVRYESREECIRALNEFIHRYATIGLVVTCSSEPYMCLQSRILLRYGFEIQPVSPIQLEQYISQVEFPERFRVIFGVIFEGDSLVITPFLLYCIQSIARNENLTNRLLNEANPVSKMVISMYYIEAKLGTKPRWPYSHKDTIRWLCWIANVMNENSQKVFLVEDIQPKSLNTSVSQAAYVVITEVLIWIIYGMLIGITIGISVSVITGFWMSLLYGIFMGSIAGIVAGIINSASIGVLKSVSLALSLFGSVLRLGIQRLFGLPRPPAKTPRQHIHNRSLQLLLLVIFFGLFPALLCGVIGVFLSGISGLVAFGLFGALLGGALGVFGLILYTLVEYIKGLKEKPFISKCIHMLRLDEFPKMDIPSYDIRPISQLKIYIPGIMGSILIGLISPILLHQQDWIGSMIMGITICVLVSLWLALRLEVQDKPERPNDGIIRSRNYAIIVGVVLCLLFVVFGAILGNAGILIISMSPWIFWTVQRYGGRAFIQHISLRIVGFLCKIMPWNYVGFLNDCVDIGILKRAGGRYFFEHPTIQDAFLAYNESDYREIMSRGKKDNSD